MDLFRPGRKSDSNYQFIVVFNLDLALCVHTNINTLTHTYLDIVQQTLFLVDFIGFNIVFLGQSEDAVLSGPNISPSQVHIGGLLILK